MSEPITHRTRRASLESILPTIGERKRIILTTLGDNELTVSELTARLYEAGEIPYYDRNAVAPRLTELKDEGLVETCGVRQSQRSRRAEAIWRIIK